MTPAVAGSDAEAVARRIPLSVHEVLGRLHEAGHEAWVVGGGLRDVLLGRDASDWDIATAARPEVTQQLFPDSVYENRFGTVAVRTDGDVYEVTTFRREHVYGDHRRPERVEFGVTLEEDLARRDFTMNAIAWDSGPAGPRLYDPFQGLADLRARLVRAVGRADDRFAEDALRMLRAVRFAAQLGFTIEPATLAAIARHAQLAEDLSGERVGAEVRRILATRKPSLALELMSRTGLLVILFPELAAQRGLPQNKERGRDLWHHTLATVDAADPGHPLVRLAALFHDVAKPSTLRDGHFPDHDTEGARISEAILRRLASPRREIEGVTHLVGQHMFSYGPAWGDAAIRRFIRRVGRDSVDDLLALREADNVGSALPRDAGHLGELRVRIAAELDARHPLALADLAVDGDDLQVELGIAPGPEVGRILGALLDRVVTEPGLNERTRLIHIARRIHERGASARTTTPPRGDGSGLPGEPSTPQQA